VAKNRPISTIAYEIKANWKPVNFAAKPYLEAMYDLHSMSDKYIMDSASSILAGFLSNASSWRGEVAKKIKKELTDMIKGKDTITESSEKLRQDQAERDLQVADNQFQKNRNKSPHAQVFDTEIGPLGISIFNGQYRITTQSKDKPKQVVFHGDRGGAKSFLAKNYIEGNLYESVPDGVLKGLAHWVSDYKITRKHGNVTLAKQIKAGIDKEIKKYKLDPDKIYGSDPDDPKNKKSMYESGSLSPSEIDGLRLRTAKEDIKILDRDEEIAVADTVNGTIFVRKENGRYIITKSGNMHQPLLAPKVLFNGDRVGATKFLATQYIVDIQEEGSDLDKTEAQKTKEKQTDDLDRIKDKQAYDLEKAREKDFKKKQQEREADRREKDVQKKSDDLKKESIDEAFEKLDFK
jgi:hypothetical protein